MGLWGGIAWSGLDTVLFKGNAFSGKAADWIFGPAKKPEDVRSLFLLRVVWFTDASIVDIT